MLDLRFQPMQDRPPIPGGKHRAASFKVTPITMYGDLERELNHLGASDIVVESGHARTMIRNDGWPKGGSSPLHPAVRIHFQTPKLGAMRFECNAYWDWEHNLRAIGLCLQDLRMIRERGIGSGTEQYRGFAGLPPGATEAAKSSLFATVEDAAAFLLAAAGLGRQGPSVASVIEGNGALTQVYREASRKNHPDTGGDAAAMARVTAARDFIEANATTAAR